MLATGVEITSVYDGVAYWTLNGYHWHRWRKGSAIRERLDTWAAANHVTIHDTPPEGYA